MRHFNSDLAVEMQEAYKEQDEKTPGVRLNESKHENISISHVEVLNDVGAEKMGKPIGNYITIDIPPYAHYDAETVDSLSRAVSTKLSELIDLKDEDVALVVGLGNWNVTPDALGPKVISKIMITRHLMQLVPDNIDDKVRPVCGISPGVLGLTGIETGEIIKGVVEKIKPKLVICIDALAARKLSRVHRTVQICDTGISPGGGIGNRRMEINEKNIGAKVIAIGVPTVVNATVIANDAIEMIFEEMIDKYGDEEDFRKMISFINEDDKWSVIQNVLTPFYSDLAVTPKDVDQVVDSLAKILANSVNIALQPALTLDDINRYIQ
ncbi:MAG: GPR endopeptidase [Oscillospiraceae bacterium]|nr:GPR endopeptidase [Oscillospiraceae bacterium]